MLWLSNLPPIKARYFTIVFQAKQLSHSIELPYKEGGESVCLIGPWDSNISVLADIYHGTLCPG